MDKIVDAIYKNEEEIVVEKPKIVFEKDQKDKANTLYLYIENIDGVTYAKFGEAFKQTVWERYDATGYTQHSKQIKVWKSSVGDKPIH